MKNILEEAIRMGVRSQGGYQGSGRQRVKCCGKQSDSPGKDGKDSDTGTEGYTSGALSSEDNFVINSQRTAREIDIAHPQVRSAKALLPQLDLLLATKFPVGDSGPLTTSHKPL